MKNRPDATDIYLARYAVWERSAGAAVACLAIAIAASLYVHVPGVLFFIGNLLVGTLVFLCWRMFLKGQTSGMLAIAFLVIICALAAASTEVHQPRSVVLSQGFGLSALALFACILAARTRASSQ